MDKESDEEINHNRPRPGWSSGNYNSITNPSNGNTYLYSLKLFGDSNSQKHKTHADTQIFEIKDQKQSKLLKIIYKKKNNNKKKVSSFMQNNNFPEAEQKNMEEQCDSEKLFERFTNTITDATKLTKPEYQFRGYMFAKKYLNPLKNQNIMKVYDVFMSGHNAYVVMEKIQEGKIIEDFRQISFFQVYKYYRALLEVLKDFTKVQHQLGSRFVHRDLKRQNILIDKDDKVKIIDMGHSKVVASSNSKRTHDSTYVCMPFEYFNCGLNQKMDYSKVDLWSLGIFVYEIIFACQKSVYDKINNRKESILPNALQQDRQFFKQQTKRVQDLGFKKVMRGYAQNTYPPIFDDIFNNTFVKKQQRSLQKLLDLTKDKEAWKQEIQKFEMQNGVYRVRNLFLSYYFFWEELVSIMETISQYLFGLRQRTANQNQKFFIGWVEETIYWMIEQIKKQNLEQEFQFQNYQSILNYKNLNDFLIQFMKEKTIHFCYKEIDRERQRIVDKIQNFIDKMKKDHQIMDKFVELQPQQIQRKYKQLKKGIDDDLYQNLRKMTQNISKFCISKCLPFQMMPQNSENLAKFSSQQLLLCGLFMFIGRENVLNEKKRQKFFVQTGKWLKNQSNYSHEHVKDFARNYVTEWLYSIYGFAEKVSKNVGDTVMIDEGQEQGDFWYIQNILKRIQSDREIVVSVLAGKRKKQMIIS